MGSRSSLWEASVSDSCFVTPTFRLMRREVPDAFAPFKSYSTIEGTTTSFCRSCKNSRRRER